MKKICFIIMGFLTLIHEEFTVAMSISDLYYQIKKIIVFKKYANCVHHDNVVLKPDAIDEAFIIHSALRGGIAKDSMYIMMQSDYENYELALKQLKKLNDEFTKEKNNLGYNEKDYHNNVSVFFNDIDTYNPSNIITSDFNNLPDSYRSSDIPVIKVRSNVSIFKEDSKDNSKKDPFNRFSDGYIAISPCTTCAIDLNGGDLNCVTQVSVKDAIKIWKDYLNKEVTKQENR
jgi:hypothetical protein